MSQDNRSESVVNMLTVQFQAEAENVCSLSVYIAGFEDLQRQGAQIVRQYTQDLRNGYDAEFALKIARAELRDLQSAITNRLNELKAYNR